MVIDKSDNNNGTSTWSFENGTEQVRCNDCDRWVHTDSSDRIKHSSRCDTPQAQPISKSATAPVVANEPRPLPYNRDGRGNGLTSDELIAAVKRGYLTQDEAMNTDF